MLSLQEKEVRLFDKGEMNTYRDEVGFVRLVGNNLQLLLSSVGDDNTNEHTATHQEDLGCDLNKSIESVAKYTVKSSFLDAGDYCSDTLGLYRLLTLEWIISGNQFESRISSKNLPCQVVNSLLKEAWKEV